MVEDGNAIMDWVQALLPPSLLTAVVIWLMRDVKADFRALKSDMDAFRKDVKEELRNLSAENRALGREVSELRGSLRPVPDREA